MAGKNSQQAAPDRPEIASSVITGDFKTNYHDVGSGDPILLIHGSGPGVTAWSNWNKVFPLLGDSFRLLVPDMAGFGYTERIPGVVNTMNSWVQQVVDFLDAMTVDKVHLIGNSFGGAVALAMTVLHPERIDKLVLMGTAGISFPITYGLDRVWGYEPSLENMEELLHIFTYDHAFATPDLIRSRFEGSIQPGFHESFSSMFPEPRQRWVDWMAAYEHYIHDIQNDTLLVHGLQDRVIPVENSMKLLTMIPNSQLHVFGKCGHWTQIEHTVEFCDLVRDFLQYER
ncbi:MAG: alpha/beta fold hydrolase [Propionibacteriaceae bacterium]|nr:alpha/beta fold hydrolase [Propionibacteriaceae bacterium]